MLFILHAYGIFFVLFGYTLVGLCLIEGFLLSQIEGISGSPEKSLSDLGRLSYESYWKFAIIRLIFSQGELRTDVSVQEISATTGIDINDFAATLEQLASATQHHSEN
ncbi:hypothetical protein ACTXT7_012395 [Hymenolepis weldensis]